jgi:hypothetical protein
MIHEGFGTASGTKLFVIMERVTDGTPGTIRGADWIASFMIAKGF